MKRIWIIAFLFCGSAMPLHAQKTPEQCAAIDDGAERLICYDLIHRVERASVPDTLESEWRVRSETSRIDDSTNVYMTLQSSDTIPGRFSRGSAHATIYVRCLENTTSLYIVMGGHHLADIQGYGRVTYRIDDAPAQSKNFSSSTDSQALGLWNGGSSIPFIRQLFGASNLLIQITPFSESPITVDFTVKGIEEAIAPLREACNW